MTIAWKAVRTGWTVVVRNIPIDVTRVDVGLRMMLLMILFYDADTIRCDYCGDDDFRDVFFCVMLFSVVFIYI